MNRKDATRIQTCLTMEKNNAPAEWKERLDPQGIDGVWGKNSARALSNWHQFSATHVRGLDMSSWQPENLDWQKIYDAGARFIILRCSVGTARDKEFADKLRGARSAGLVVGAYQFMKPGTDAWLTKQALIAYEHCKQAGFFDVPEHERFPVVMDIEKNLEGPDETPNTADDVKADDHMAEFFADALENLFGEVPILYSFTPYLSTHKISVPRCQYWGADWRPQGLLTVHEGWTNYLIHQYQGDTGRWPGVTTNGKPAPVDLNRFNGDDAVFRRYLQTRKLTWES